MKPIIQIIALSLILTSCSRFVPYTSFIHKKNNFSEEQLKKVQFYISGEIVLTKIKNTGDALVDNGKVIIRDAKDVEIVSFKENTPCIISKVIDNDKFLCNFEQGEDRVLLFGGDYFSLMSKEWKNKKGTLTYASKIYSTESGNVFLKIKMKQLRKLKARKRVVRGKRI